MITNQVLNRERREKEGETRNKNVLSPTPYRGAVGSLLYLANATKPIRILYAMNVLSRHQVKIKCASKDDVAKLEAQLTDQIGSDYMVKQEVMQNPRLKIVVIDNNFTAEEFDIRERNFKNSDFYCSVEHTYGSFQRPE